MAKLRFGNHTIKLPRNRAMRIGIGILLIFLGFLGFLPVLGFWMIPLGLVVLSIDIPSVRKSRRKMQVKLGHWLKANYPSLAACLGHSNGRKRV